MKSRTASKNTLLPTFRYSTSLPLSRTKLLLWHQEPISFSKFVF